MIFFFFLVGGGAPECQQIHYPLSELPRAERDGVDEGGSMDGWIDGCQCPMTHSC